VFSPKIPEDLTINIVIKDKALLITAEQLNLDVKQNDFLDNVKMGLSGNTDNSKGYAHFCWVIKLIV
jgi:hypothetical protein